MPSGTGGVQFIPAPTLMARAVVGIKITTTGAMSTAGANCILAKANDPAAVYVQNNNNLISACGIAIDPGVFSDTLGGISFKNPHDMVHLTSLTIADTTGFTTSTAQCSGHCFQYGTISTALQPTLKATPDPYTSALNFTNPFGVSSASFTAGSGYTGSSCTFNLMARFLIPVIGANQHNCRPLSAKVQLAVSR